MSDDELLDLIDDARNRVTNAITSIRDAGAIINREIDINPSFVVVANGTDAYLRSILALLGVSEVLFKDLVQSARATVLANNHLEARRETVPTVPEFGRSELLNLARDGDLDEF
ncbi:MAG: hypothetical protein HKO03_01720 [Acidimicrobiia bacterium]|nr:hypothetical protein [Acidimicrobiia bacterium]